MSRTTRERAALIAAQEKIKPQIKPKPNDDVFNKASDDQ